eukprot:TRINITY_DN20965_c0_g2_i1.p1 TRINITY_DN20965_c0_g2~~TRINITY_DN20965_c0_g2_i1.p1  ORF type:complete len:462 (-),score=106.12 TRINITY_DN20965_c0_g2_i1:31-1392(-)
METIDAGSVKSAETCTNCLEALAACDLQLGSAENFADAAGRNAACELLRASRAHLCSLAADALVSRALVGASLVGIDVSGGGAASAGSSIVSDRETAALEMLLPSEDDDSEGCSQNKNAANSTVTLGSWVGRLGDYSVTECLDAYKAIDSVVESAASLALASMCSGALQAAAQRLRALPPGGDAEAVSVECRRAALSMLTRAVQVLPTAATAAGAAGSGSTAASSAASAGRYALGSAAVVAAGNAGLVAGRLAAHAHLLQGEVLSERGGGGERLQRTAAWHLSRAGTALHGLQDAESPLGATAILRAHLHVALASSSSVATDRHGKRSGGCGGGGGIEAEMRAKCRALRELLAGCGAVGSGGGRKDWHLLGCWREPGAEIAARVEARLLLLKRLQELMRDLCGLEVRRGDARSAAGDGSCRWRSAYRSTLQLSAEDIGSAPQRFAAFLDQESI